MSDIDQLVKGCKNADPAAQRSLLERYTPLLFSVSLRYAVDRNQAKDILQDSWIKIFNGIEKYKHEGNLDSWMCRIVINTALRNMQSSEMKNAVYTESFFEKSDRETTALEDLQYDDLLRVVNQLPSGSREVFKLAAIDGLKHKEIAKILSIKESTSRAHLTRAKSKLREIIEDIDKVKSYDER